MLGAYSLFPSTWGCSRIYRRAHFLPFYAHCVERAPSGHDNTIGVVIMGLDQRSVPSG